MEVMGPPSHTRYLKDALPLVAEAYAGTSWARSH